MNCIALHWRQQRVLTIQRLTHVHVAAVGFEGKTQSYVQSTHIWLNHLIIIYEVYGVCVCQLLSAENKAREWEKWFSWFWDPKLKCFIAESTCNYQRVIWHIVRSVYLCLCRHHFCHWHEIFPYATISRRTTKKSVYKLTIHRHCLHTFSIACTRLYHYAHCIAERIHTIHFTCNWSMVSEGMQCLSSVRCVGTPGTANICAHKRILYHLIIFAGVKIPCRQFHRSFIFYYSTIASSYGSSAAAALCRRTN